MIHTWRRLLSAVAVAFLLLSGCSVDTSVDSAVEALGDEADDPTPAAARTASYSSNGLSFDYPEEWVVDDDWDLWNFGVAILVLDFGDDANLIMTITGAEPDEPLDDPLQDYPWDLDERTDRVTNGVEIAEGTHTMETLGVEIDLEVMAAVQRIDNYQINVQLASPQDEFDDHRAGFDQLLETLEFEAEDAG